MKHIYVSVQHTTFVVHPIEMWVIFFYEPLSWLQYLPCLRQSKVISRNPHILIQGKIMLSEASDHGKAACFKNKSLSSVNTDRANSSVIVTFKPQSMFTCAPVHLSMMAIVWKLEIGNCIVLFFCFPIGIVPLREFTGFRRKQLPADLERHLRVIRNV